MATRSAKIYEVSFYKQGSRKITHATTFKKTRTEAAAAIKRKYPGCRIETVREKSV